MATLGNSAKPSSGQQWFGLNTGNVQAHLLTMTERGQITRMGAWLAGKDGSAAVKLCLWTAAGTLVAQTATITVASKTFGLGQSAQYEADLVTPYTATEGQVLYAGWTRDPADSHQFGTYGGGTRYTRTNTGTWPANLSGLSSDTGSISTYLIYDSNQAPNAPTITSPKGSTVIADTTPDLKFSASDPDGDGITNYDLQVSTDSSFASVTHWNLSAQTTGISGLTVTRTYAGTALTRGTMYYWRARTRDADGLVGAWSSTASFKINQLPTAVARVPGSTNGLAYIWNLGSDTAVWTSGGSNAKPRFSWDIDDPEGSAQSAFRVRIYSASSGGTLLYDSGKITTVTMQHDANYGVVLGTSYWWTIEVWDGAGESGGEQARTAFRVRWAQAIYEQAVTGGTSSNQWSFVSGGVTTNTYAAFLFASATGAAGSGRSSWKTTIGALSPNAYLNVLVRLSTTVSGTNPALPDMTFNYNATGVLPDKWSTSGTGTFSLDEDVRRFGSRSFRIVGGASIADHYVWSPQVPVTPNTTYTASAYVRTDGSVSPGHIDLMIWGNGGAGVIAAAGVGATTTDTSAYPDGWMRMKLMFTTSTDTNAVDFYAVCRNQPIGARWWTDAWQLEEGTVASVWRPGLVGGAAAIDVSGVMIDGSKGGIFRLLTDDGDSIELTPSGLDMDAGWITPTLLNSWANYGSSYNTAGYRKDASGYVHIRGLIRNGTVDLAAFTLPAGYRPSGTILWPTISNSLIGRVDIASSGNVVPASPSSTNWVSLEGIVFKAEN